MGLEADATKRRNKRKQRRETLFKKAFELTSTCGGDVFVMYRDLNDKTTIYTNTNELYNLYRTTGLKSSGTMVESRHIIKVAGTGPVTIY